jgi:metal iron transporter
VRRLLTRLLGLIPSVIVAVSVGRSGINAMLIASQVVLSIVLPFIIFPLVWLTSSRAVMRVRAERKGGAEEEQGVLEDEYIDFSNGWIIAGIGYVILALTVVANGYVLITLVIGAS